MPPKSRQNQNELVSCEICGCLFITKDTPIHMTLCEASAPFVLPLDASEDIILDLKSMRHAIIVGQALIGTVQELKEKDIPENFPASFKDLVIQLNPAVMKHCHISFGRTIVINNEYAFDAWPNPAIPLMGIGLSPKARDSMRLTMTGESTYLMVHPLIGPSIDAETVLCSIKNNQAVKDEKQFCDYIIRQTVGRHLANGNSLYVNYYGQPVEITITEISGIDGSNLLMFSKPAQNCDMYSLTCGVHALGLQGESPIKTSTPVKKRQDDVNKTLDIVSQQPTFFIVTHNTKLVLQQEQQNKSQDVPRIKTLQDFGGFRSQLDGVKEMIDTHLFHSEILEEHGMHTPQGVLLYGPSGGGKTLLAQAVASEFPVKLITVNGAEIWSKFYGESEAKLVSVFSQAMYSAPSIIFLDEVDSLCPKRESCKNEVEKRVVATLLTLLDKLMNVSRKVFVLAATNKRQDLDPALRRPGRIDREVEIGVPTVADRTEILEKLLSRAPHECSPQIIQDVAEKAHSYLGSDLTALCKEATLHAIKKIESGDQRLVITSDDLLYGLKVVKPSAMKEVTLEVSKVSWTDIGGQEELKHKLRQAVEWPLKHPEAFTRLGIRPPRGLLMYGPPGCSKTMIAKALAKESGLNFLAIKGPELFSKWVGESERAVRELFHRARAAAPAIVFFDEIDALAGERGSHGGGGGDVSDRVLAQLLTEMDGVEALEDILVVAATNRPDMIDKALMRPGRLDRIIYVPLPDRSTREAIFTIQCKKTPIAADVDIQQLVDKTDGYSGAETSAVCHEAALAAMQENINISHVHMHHFDAALRAVTPRITPELLEIYEKYQAQGTSV